jgi:hypothetical protein
VARAAVGATRPPAALALEPGEALALACSSIADTCTRTLGVFVVFAVRVGSIHPGNLVRANAIRTITRVVRQTYTPSIITLTYTFDIASTYETNEKEKRNMVNILIKQQQKRTSEGQFFLFQCMKNNTYRGQNRNCRMMPQWQ